MFEYSRGTIGLPQRENLDETISLRNRQDSRPGGENVLAVRVYNQSGLGDIWKPVHRTNNKDRLSISILTMTIQHTSPVNQKIRTTWVMTAPPNCPPAESSTIANKTWTADQ